MIDRNVTFAQSLSTRLEQAIGIAAAHGGYSIHSPESTDALAGAAMLELIDLDLFPAYAIDGPWIDKLYADGIQVEPPELLCLLTSDAILLAPSKVGTSQWSGFLIAKSTASGMVRDFAKIEADKDTERVMLQVPKGVIKRSAFVGAKCPALLDIVQ